MSILGLLRRRLWRIGWKRKNGMVRGLIKVLSGLNCVLGFYLLSKNPCILLKLYTEFMWYRVYPHIASGFLSYSLYPLPFRCLALCLSCFPVLAHACLSFLSFCMYKVKNLLKNVAYPLYHYDIYTVERLYIKHK